MVALLRHYSINLARRKSFNLTALDGRRGSTLPMVALLRHYSINLALRLLVT